jgi:hypothetical protein
VTDIEGAFRTATKSAVGSKVCSFALVAALAAACAGKSTPESHAPARDEKSYYDDTTSSSSRDSNSDKAGDESSDATKVGSKEPAEPVFSENMSVDEAIKAVPPGIERRNIDQETLGKPLQDLSLYESCKPGSARVKVRVAVWDGKAVGIDLNVTPKNDKLADCIKGKIREVTWDKKVKSLNTIEYQF